jgi:hypothetical protein
VQFKNQGGPDSAKPLIARRAFGVIVIGILALGAIFTVRLLFSLLKETPKRRRRR